MAILIVTVPATSANLGPGFDCVGIALDLVNALYFSTEKNEIKALPHGAVPLSAGSLAHQGFKLVAEMTGKKMPSDLSVAIGANVPRSRGLGSSATLTVAGIVAANVLLQADLSEEEIITLANRIEGHPDNAAPAYLGGLVVSISSEEGIKYLKVEPPQTLRAVVAVPDFELATAAARKVLPTQVSRQDAVFNAGHFGLFMTAILTGNVEMLGLAMEDRLHQPYRTPLVPGLQEVMAAALAQGALGCCLSGAGPSVLAFCNRADEEIGEAMKNTWRCAGIKAEIFLLNISLEGTKYTFI
jgi:homoserine kinase